jgi:hypothetical protein
MLPIPSSTARSTTAISLCASEEVTARILHPVPEDSEARIASVEPGRIVLYMVETPRRPRVFAFRTLPGDSAAGATVPGVSRAVDLFFATRTRAAASRVRNMLIYFQRRCIGPDTLSEDFWLKLGVLLDGRLRRGPHLASLLAAEDAA